MYQDDTVWKWSFNKKGKTSLQHWMLVIWHGGEHSYVSIPIWAQWMNKCSLLSHLPLQQALKEGTKELSLCLPGDCTRTTKPETLVVATGSCSSDRQAFERLAQVSWMQPLFWKGHPAPPSWAPDVGGLGTYSKPEGLPQAGPSGPSNASRSESGWGDTFILDLDLLFHRLAFVKGETEPSRLSLLQPLRMPACISLLPKSVQGATGLCFSSWGNGLWLLSQSFFDFPCLTVAAAVSGEHPVYPAVSALSLDSQNAALGLLDVSSSRYCQPVLTCPPCSLAGLLYDPSHISLSGIWVPPFKRRKCDV